MEMKVGGDEVKIAKEHIIFAFDVITLIQYNSLSLNQSLEMGTLKYI